MNSEFEGVQPDTEQLARVDACCGAYRRVMDGLSALEARLKEDRDLSIIWAGQTINATTNDIPPFENLDSRKRLMDALRSMDYQSDDLNTHNLYAAVGVSPYTLELVREINAAKADLKQHLPGNKSLISGKIFNRYIAYKCEPKAKRLDFLKVYRRLPVAEPFKIDLGTNIKMPLKAVRVGTHNHQKVPKITLSEAYRIARGYADSHQLESDSLLANFPVMTENNENRPCVSLQEVKTREKGIANLSYVNSGHKVYKNMPVKIQLPIFFDITASNKPVASRVKPQESRRDKSARTLTDDSLLLDCGDFRLYYSGENKD